jgi:hypothetical protein
MYELSTSKISCMKARMLLFVLAVTCVLLFPASAFANENPDFYARFRPGADGRSVNLSESLRAPMAQNASHSGSSNPKRLSPIVYSADQFHLGVEDVRGNITSMQTLPCDPNTFPILHSPTTSQILSTPFVGDGVVYSGEKTNRVTGDVLESYLYCKDPNASTTQPPRGMAPAPTYFDIWNAVYTNAFDDVSQSSGVSVAPAAPGLVGLPTAMWSEFPNGQTISRDVVLPGGYRIQASAFVEEVEIYVTDSSGNDVTAETLRPDVHGHIDGGDFDHPAATYAFRKKGTYTITTGVVWTSNNATLSGPGIPTIVVPLGSLRLEISRDYPVNEMRSALVN